MDILEQIEKELAEVKKVEGIKDIEGVVERRSRNTRIIDLVEGDVLVTEDGYFHVTEGEVAIYADGLIDETSGALAPVSIEAVTDALARGGTIFNMEDIGGK